MWEKGQRAFIIRQSDKAQQARGSIEILSIKQTIQIKGRIFLNERLF